jgi:hypothetical protein
VVSRRTGAAQQKKRSGSHALRASCLSHASRLKFLLVLLVTGASDGNCRLGTRWLYLPPAVATRNATRPRVRSPGDGAAKVARGTVPVREAWFCADFPICSE